MTTGTKITTENDTATENQTATDFGAITLYRETGFQTDYLNLLHKNSSAAEFDQTVKLLNRLAEGSGLEKLVRKVRNYHFDLRKGSSARAWIPDIRAGERIAKKIADESSDLDAESADRDADRMTALDIWETILDDYHTENKEQDFEFIMAIALIRLSARPSISKHQRNDAEAILAGVIKNAKMVIRDKDFKLINLDTDASENLGSFLTVEMMAVIFMWILGEKAFATVES